MRGVILLLCGLIYSWESDARSPFTAKAPPAFAKPSPILRHRRSFNRRRTDPPAHRWHSQFANSRQDADAADVAKRPRICVVGGGFGGLYTALLLSRFPFKKVVPEVVLIDEKERFVFLPLLYELAMGAACEDEVAPLYADLLEGESSEVPISFMRGRVAHVDVDNRELHFEPLPDPSSAIPSPSPSPFPPPDRRSFSWRLHIAARLLSVLAFPFRRLRRKKRPDGRRTAASVGASGVSPPLTYDTLVLATGSVLSFGGCVGAADHCVPFYTLDDARALQGIIAELEDKIRRQKRRKDATVDRGEVHRSSEPDDAHQNRKIKVIVIGAGYAGVELATNLVSRLGPDSTEVSLIHRGPTPLPDAHPAMRNEALDALRQLGVDLRLNTAVREVRGVYHLGERECVEVDVVTEIPAAKGRGRVRTRTADLVVWTAGRKMCELVERLPLSKDGSGRIVVDRTLAATLATDVSGSTGIYALGDCAVVDGHDGVPMSAQAALQQADYVGWNVWAAYNGFKPLQYKYTHLGEMLSFGPEMGAAQLGSLPIPVQGMPAALLRRLHAIARQPTSRQRLRAGMSWLDGALGTRGLLKYGSSTRDPPLNVKLDTNLPESPTASGQVAEPSTDERPVAPPPSTQESLVDEIIEQWTPPALKPLARALEPLLPPLPIIPPAFVIDTAEQVARTVFEELSAPGEGATSGQEVDSGNATATADDGATGEGQTSSEAMLVDDERPQVLVDAESLMNASASAPAHEDASNDTWRRHESAVRLDHHGDDSMAMAMASQHPFLAPLSFEDFPFQPDRAPIVPPQPPESSTDRSAPIDEHPADGDGTPPTATLLPNETLQVYAERPDEGEGIGISSSDDADYRHAEEEGTGTGSDAVLLASMAQTLLASAIGEAPRLLVKGLDQLVSEAAKDERGGRSSDPLRGPGES